MSFAKTHSQFLSPSPSLAIPPPAKNSYQGCLMPLLISENVAVVAGVVQGRAFGIPTRSIHSNPVFSKPSRSFYHVPRFDQASNSNTAGSKLVVWQFHSDVGASNSHG